MPFFLQKSVEMFKLGVQTVFSGIHRIRPGARSAEIFQIQRLYGGHP